MKRKLKILIGIVSFIFFILCGLHSLLAQDYRTAIGLRFGGTSGITIKHNYSAMGAYEGIIGFFNHGFSLTGLVERHPQAFHAEGLHWYFGVGTHLAFYNNNESFEGFGRNIDKRNEGDIGLGIDGILGLEYKFPPKVPLALSIGIKPFIEINSDGDVGIAPDPGFGLKFLIR